MEFLKRYAYIILGGVCVLALGGLFLLTRSNPTGVIETGRSRALHTEVMGQEPESEQPGAASPQQNDPPNLDDLPALDDPPSQYDSPDSYDPEQPDDYQPPEQPMIMVHIEGAVRYPGVYEVPYGSRVNDVLQLAGGSTDYADLARINLAAFAYDATRIIVPTIGEDIPELAPQDSPPQSGQETGGAIMAGGIVNINLASLEELQTLPGIGPVIAQNIIDYREANNGFSTIEELLNVSRIGEATFENLRNSVSVE